MEEKKFNVTYPIVGEVTLQVIAGNEEEENSSVIKCPECLEISSKEELQMFGGMCESCCDYPF